VSPIDYVCHECGASFEVGVGSLLSDDYQPGCPACDGKNVQTDWDAVTERFGDTVQAASKSPAAEKTPRRRKLKLFESLRSV
jgi:hypothetical protein